MKLEDIKQGISTVLDSVTETVADGWHRVRESATSALTRFSPGEKDNLPATGEVDDNFYIPSASWSMIAGNVFEDDNKVVVRLEIPGMDKENFAIDVRDNALHVSGEKRFEREVGEGRYRSFQCAYGSFRRSVSLPAAVIAEKASASYRDGILRVELPKEKQEKPRRIDVRIN